MYVVTNLQTRHQNQRLPNKNSHRIPASRTKFFRIRIYYCKKENALFTGIIERFKFDALILICRGETALAEADSRFDSKIPRKFSKKGKKTITRTFRINEEWNNILSEEAEKQGISVNVLVNLIFRRYARFDRWTRDHKVISLTQDSFREIIRGIPTVKLAKTGEFRGAPAIQSIIDVMGLPANYESFAFLVPNFFGRGYALWFSCHCHFRENRDIFHLQHDLGGEWSVFLQNYFGSYLKTLKIEYETKVYDYALNLTVHRPP
jgi:hypothetical protein